MSVKFFGQFLLERGVVGREALLRAIDLQASRNLRLGDYAIRRGYLTEAQSEQINQAQLSADKRFGELAVEMGLLSGAQVDELLTLQENDYILLGEALLEEAVIDRAVLERELKAFKEDQERYLVDDVIFPPGIPDASFLAVPVDLTAKLLMRLCGIQGKIGESEREVRPPVGRLVTVTIAFSGALNAHYTLSVSRDLAELVAARILGEPPKPDEDEVVLDSVKELCNVICGNAAAKYAQLGRRVEIGPPTVGAPRLPDGKKYVLFPLHVAEGAVEIRILP